VTYAGTDKNKTQTINKANTHSSNTNQAISQAPYISVDQVHQAISYLINQSYS
jgi:hypothetical protein